ncbi:transcriptional regulator [Methylosinus sp. C49]|jgi:molybdate transport system regulatory protein|uniref:TOBE domain-containing protein n=1 Tax=Methylosinus sp. C49 TaxID=2699395 RepID=UPI0013676D0F|nr:TOBE domain-containing protein [Methylosinus sp. C49]BBU60225.1 transcriptional regulator [Methylosinus sp. C49]
MTVNKIDALLALRSEGRFLVGRDRIKLLEAVAEYGSITKAAKVVGFSYKTAWDAVNAINNLLPSPAFVTKAGGRSGGGAEVTQEGRRLIATFHRLEERLSRISSLIAEEGLEDQDDFLLWSVGVKISARNVFQTEVVSVKKWPVDVEVTLRVSPETSIHAIVTNDSAVELGLEPGRKTLALIKSSFVHLTTPEHTPPGVRNQFVGVVRRRIDAERNSEVLLDIGAGKTMHAVVPRQTAEDLGIAEGERAVASFSPTDVILAVD